MNVGHLFETTPKTQPIKEIIDKWDSIKIKNLHSVKDNIKRRTV